MTTDADKIAQAVKEQMEKFSQTFKLPDVDVKALIERQRNTIDAIAKAAQLSNETAAEVSRHQLEILRSASEHVASMMRDMKLSGEQGRELAAKSFEAALTSAREFAEMTAKSNAEVFNLIKQRMTDNFEQMRKNWRS
ncbi:TIGR01841 family phasin [Bradyrhizobium manausense]|uniref:TIGR01841 family phasin n=1 Tax=Bradyrhizobium manausense TaxID=989370 RepID=UPI001BAB0612|nr:TIGR01841 family phasin [Bradyrhizobium manausense]MBR0691532.1 TIGR01841 family phasin [Bradyrhizobium manausense]